MKWLRRSLRRDWPGLLALSIVICSSIIGVWAYTPSGGSVLSIFGSSEGFTLARYQYLFIGAFAIAAALIAYWGAHRTLLNQSAQRQLDELYSEALAAKRGSIIVGRVKTHLVNALESHKDLEIRAAREMLDKVVQEVDFMRHASADTVGHILLIEDIIYRDVGSIRTEELRIAITLADSALDELAWRGASKTPERRQPR